MALAFEEQDGYVFRFEFRHSVAHAQAHSVDNLVAMSFNQNCRLRVAAALHGIEPSPACALGCKCTSGCCNWSMKGVSDLFSSNNSGRIWLTP